MKFVGKLARMLRQAARRIASFTKLVIQNVKATVKSLWRNAEGVAILTLGSLGTAHFVGSYVFENPTLANLIFAEMIGPVAAVGVIWLLLRSMIWRRNRRARRMATAF